MFLHDYIPQIISFANSFFCSCWYHGSGPHTIGERDIFLMSFGPDPVQAEFCISAVYCSYYGDDGAGSLHAGALQRQLVTDPDSKTSSLNVNL